MTVDEFLDRLERVKKKNGGGWTARCPAHEDRKASLSIGVGDDERILLKCFAGCSVESITAAVGREPRDLFPRGEGGGYTPQSRRQVDQVVQVGPRLATVDGEPVDSSEGLTLEALAAAKKLPVELLAELGCETVSYFGPKAVQIPYSDEQGDIVGIRYRLALAGEAKFRWKKGTKAAQLLYGASRLREARELGYIILVEGESDYWTLLHHGFPAVALPGAGMWSEKHAGRLDGIEKVFVVSEPDKGGETLVESLRASSIRPRVQVVRLEVVKDLSELYLDDPDRFADRLKTALEQADRLLDLEEEERRAEAAAHWLRCAELAGESTILDTFATELLTRGFVGPVEAAKLIFLVLVSRRLKKPVSLVLRGLSSAGKSYTVESVLVFFPPSAYFSRSGMSDRALIFSEESFQHRVLYIAEADAIAGDGMSAYFLRTLISENKLVYEITEKVDDRHVTRVITKPGPVGTIITTTRLRLHPENETRMLALTVSDDPGLTRQIMRAIALKDDEADQEPPEPWHALQEWLELGGEQRVVDEDGFLLDVAEQIPVVAVRLRRDFALVRSLVFAHAILHQASRSRDGRGRIIATLEDYAVVRDLIADVVAEGIGATIPEDVRETVAAVETALGLNVLEETVKRADVEPHLGLDTRAAGRRLAQAVDAGFVVNTNPGRGKTAQYKLGAAIPDDVDVLPTVEALNRAKNSNLDNLDNLATDPGGTPPSPPSVQADIPFDDYRLDDIPFDEVPANGPVPVPGDDGFITLIAEAHRNGHLTEAEAHERWALHKLIEETQG